MNVSPPLVSSWNMLASSTPTWLEARRTEGALSAEDAARRRPHLGATARKPLDASRWRTRRKRRLPPGVQEPFLSAAPRILHWPLGSGFQRVPGAVRATVCLRPQRESRRPKTKSSSPPIEPTWCRPPVLRRLPSPPTPRHRRPLPLLLRPLATGSSSRGCGRRQETHVIEPAPTVELQEIPAAVSRRGKPADPRR